MEEALISMKGLLCQLKRHIKPLLVVTDQDLNYAKTQLEQDLTINLICAR